jgi:hypothetical protein
MHTVENGIKINFKKITYKRLKLILVLKVKLI